MDASPNPVAAQDARGSPTYLVHGLRVRSAVRLDAPVTRAPAFDLEIHWGRRRTVPDAVPEGRLLARLTSPAGSYSLTSGRNGYSLRVHGLCDFAVDRARRNASVHLAPDAEDELASLLIGGFLATMLSLEGRCVLHASAIEPDGRAVAFVGRSGMGKTTIAALCCAAGARLVTDDVLRVDLRDGDAWCFSGSRELRLRAGAAELAKLLDTSPRRSTIDRRTAVRPATAHRGMLPLAAVLAPRWEHGSEELRIERLRGSEALLELLRFPRTVGWVDAGESRHDFGVLAGLVETVPVYRANLPWGPPFDAELSRRMLEEIGCSPIASSRPSGTLVDDARGSLACS